MNNWVRVFPFLRWFPLDAAKVRADLMAGLTVALVLVPQSMAYAHLAGLRPEYGLYAAGLPVIVAALFGWCAQLATGPVALTSLLVATTLAASGLAEAGTAEYAALAALLALMVGLIRFLVGLLRLASAAHLISHSAVAGFANAAALIIAASQLPSFLHLPIKHGEYFWADLWTMLARLGEAHPAGLGFGLASLLALALFRRFLPRWPGVLLVVAAATATSWLTGLEKSSGTVNLVIGEIPSGLPRFQAPELDWSAARQLLPGSAMIALVGFLEVLAVSKTIAARTKERLNLNQELLGQGLASIAGGFSQAFPVSGSFSRSALNLYAGARTGLSSVFAALAVMAVLFCLTPLLRHLPRAVLAAIIIAAVAGLADFRIFARIWKTDRCDGVVACATFLACMALAPRVVEGLLAGAALSIVFHLYRLMKPHVAALGRHPDGTLRDAQRHGLPTDERIVAVRFDGRLVFANAAHFEERILEELAARPRAQALLVVAEGINELDATGEDVLRRLVVELRRGGLVVVFAQLKSQVEDVLRRTGLYAALGEENLFRTPDAALAELERRLAGRAEGGKAWDSGPPAS